MTKRWRSFFLPLLLFLLFLSGMAYVQFASPDLADNDGYYHIKLASLMRTQGLKPDFPWLPFSILNEDEFYDHHFLFHVALIPFTLGDLRPGAKWAAVLFSSLAFLAVWYLFHRQRIPLAWLWALALLGISDAFLYRMSITRAQSLSLAALALGMTWMLEGKRWQLGVLAFLYVWLYDAFPLLPMLAVLHLVAIALLEHRLEYRPLLFITMGLVLGMLINPYFPDNIVFSFRHILPKLTDATAISVGNEWYPYETSQLLKNSLPALIAFGSGILALGLAGRQMDVRTALALLAALLFGGMLFQARRFIEYFPPFTLIFAAFAWAPLFPDPATASVSPMRLGPLAFPRVRLSIFLLFIVIVFSGLKSILAAQDSLRHSKPYTLYAGASAWLEENTLPGERIFQTDWDDFPRLFYYNTHNTYLVGLDPTYMQLYDQELYNLWALITRGEIQRPSQFIANQFHARYVHSDLKHENFLRQAQGDPGLREVYRDDQAVIFEVTREAVSY
ncbi:MAG: hypothetical protein ACOYYU_06950 [Chloroflexota bacterium]